MCDRCHRADVDDMPFPGFSHGRQGCLVHIDCAEKIHLKLCLCLIKRSELHRARDAEASTVDYNIEFPCFRKNLAYCLLNRIFIGHIHADVFYSVLRYISAAEFIDCKPSIFQCRGRTASDAGTASRYKSCFHCFSPFFSSFVNVAISSFLICSFLSHIILFYFHHNLYDILQNIPCELLKFRWSTRHDFLMGEVP